MIPLPAWPMLISPIIGGSSPPIGDAVLWDDSDVLLWDDSDEIDWDS